MPIVCIEIVGGLRKIKKPTLTAARVTEQAFARAEPFLRAVTTKGDPTPPSEHAFADFRIWDCLAPVVGLIYTSAHVRSALMLHACRVQCWGRVPMHVALCIRFQLQSSARCAR